MWLILVRENINLRIAVGYYDSRSRSEIRRLDCEVGNRVILVRFPTGARDFFTLQNTHNSPLIFWFGGYWWAIFLGIKQHVRETDHSTPSSAEIKNEWSCASTFRCLHDEHRDSFMLDKLMTLLLSCVRKLTGRKCLHWYLLWFASR